MPLTLHNAVTAYLYLDVRGSSMNGGGLAPGVEKFLAALGEVAAMAWANLMRLELEQRYRRLMSLGRFREAS